ncbi:MAG: Crp/Fnr family transcriptional regulator [Rhizobiaceae bacterium]|nr:Crp/Fnr family transcriptional regulator [Rhizobiaceae bacterium]
MDKFKQLRDYPIFRPLSDDAVLKLAAASKVRRLRQGDEASLYAAGDASAGVYLLARADAGKTAARLQVEFGAVAGQPTAVGYRLLDGAMAGDVEFIQGGMNAAMPARVATARLIADATVIEIPAKALVEAVRGAPDVGRLMAREVATRLTELLGAQATRRGIHADVRFARDLLAQLDDFGRVAANKGTFQRELKRETLAKNLGVARRTLSQNISDWSARGLIEDQPLGIPDLERVRTIAAFGEDDPADSLDAALRRLDALVAARADARASHAAADILAVFPGNPVASYGLALVSVRTGATAQARAILAAPAFAWDGSMASLKERLREAWRASLSSRAGPLRGEDIDVESELDALLAERLVTLAIDVGALHARLAKDEAGETDPGSAESRVRAAASARLYAEVHAAHPSHYCAVNAATMYLLADDPGAAERLAKEASRLAAREAPNYWATATVGEAALVTGDRAAARKAFGKAMTLADRDLAKVASTRRQLKLIERFAGRDVAGELAAIDGGDPVVFSGHLLKAGDATPDGLVEAERQIAQGIDRWMAEHRIAGAYTALACGSDIIFAERVLAAGIPLHIALPFSIDRFRDASVTIGNGPGVKTDWVKRYQDCLDGASSVTELWAHDIPRGQTDFHFMSCSRYLSGEAIMAAHILSAQPRMLAVLHANAPETLAGTRRAHAAFAELGFQTDVIPSPILRKPPAPPGQPSVDPFAPVIFAFARSQADNAGLDRLLQRNGFASRLMRDRRLAGHIVPRDMDEAVAVAAELAREAAAASIPIRIIADFGPVLNSSGAVELNELLRLEAAGDMTAVAVGDIFATSAFVMQSLSRGASPARYTQISVAIETDNPAAAPSFHGARQIYKVGQI